MNQELLQLLNALKTAEGLSLASIAKEVGDLKEDQAEVKKDLEKVLLQIIDKVDSIPLNEEIGKVNDKLRSEVTKLEDKLSKTGEALTATEKKTLTKIQTLIGDLREELESKVNDKSFLNEITAKIEENSFENFLKGIKEVKLETEDIKGLSEFVVSQIPKSKDFSGEIADLRNTVVSVGTKNYAPAGVEIFHNGQNFGRIPSINFIGGTLNASASRVDVSLGSGGGGGSSTFLGLTDTPSSYTGQALKVLQVNAGETALEFITLSGGGDALVANPLSQFAATTSAQLAGVISDETGSGALVFGTSPTLTTPRFADLGFIADPNGNEMLAFNSNASAVNYLEIENGATGLPPHIRARGDDTNIGLHLVGKGTGEVSVCDATDETKRIRFGVSNNGTGIITTIRSNSTGTSKTLDLPNASGTIALTSDISNIDETQLDTSVQDSLSLANTALQPANISDTVYNATTWNGVTTVAPSQNAVRDKIETMDTAIALNTAKVTNATHTGDVTGATALTIANDAVTYAKMQNVSATNRLLGRSTAGAGDVQEITVGGDLTQSGSSFTVVSASTTVAGKVELAIDSEVNTGTSATLAVTPDALAGSYAGTKNVDLYVLDAVYTITTGDGKAYFRIPVEMNGMNLVSVGASVATTSTSGTPTIQIARGRQSSATSAHSYVDILSTRITIDANEYDSKDATTAAVINTVNDDIATGDLIRIDVDVTGTGTKGLWVSLGFRLP